MDFVRASPVIFPTLTNKKWTSINTNKLAKETLAKLQWSQEEESLFNNPAFCEDTIEAYAESLEVDFTYERAGIVRDILWRGHYMNPISMKHLGNDYNVPGGTLVTAPFDCIVQEYVSDQSVGGWGTAVILRPEKGDLILFAHLLEAPKEGSTLKKGDTIGHVGHSSVNGGWYPHLHVQGLARRTFLSFSNDCRIFSYIDGYGLNDRPVPSYFPDMHETVFCDS